MSSIDEEEKGLSSSLSAIEEQKDVDRNYTEDIQLIVDNVLSDFSPNRPESSGNVSDYLNDETPIANTTWA